MCLHCILERLYRRLVEDFLDHSLGLPYSPRIHGLRTEVFVDPISSFVDRQQAFKTLWRYFLDLQSPHKAIHIVTKRVATSVPPQLEMENSVPPLS